MVRRATVDRSPQSVADYDTVAPGAASRYEARLPAWYPAQGLGRGGRWLVWLFNDIAWLVVIVIRYNGFVFG